MPIPNFTCVLQNDKLAKSAHDFFVNFYLTTSLSNLNSDLTENRKNSNFSSNFIEKMYSLALKSTTKFELKNNFCYY